MKKTLFFIAGAFSLSFTNIQAKGSLFQTYYYWLVKAGEGANVTFNNVDLQVYYGSTAPINPCSGTPTYKCVVGFTSNQITSPFGFTILKTDISAQPNRVTLYKRPTI